MSSAANSDAGPSTSERVVVAAPLGQAGSSLPPRDFRRRGRDRGTFPREQPPRPPKPDSASLTVQDITVDHAPTDQHAVNHARDEKRTSVKPTSESKHLHDALCSAAAIAAAAAAATGGNSGKSSGSTATPAGTVRAPPASTETSAAVDANPSSVRVALGTSIKDVNRFLQAISHRDPAIFDELFVAYKPAVVVILQRLVDVTSGKHAEMIPAAHEWIIRCEEHGVGDAAWSTGLSPPNSGDDGEWLMTPAEMLAKMLQVDPVGLQLRRIEMCQTAKALARAAIRLADDSSFASVADAKQTATAIGRLLSKARRVVAAQLKDISTDDSIDEAKVRAHLAKQLRLIVARCSAAMEALKANSSGTSTSGTAPIVPTHKLQALIAWAKENGLADEEIVTAGQHAESEASSSLELQAQQMEFVLTLKTIASSEALHEALVAMATDTAATFEGVHALRLRSPDVLSAVGVAAGGAAVTAETKALAVRTLIASQRALGEGSTLPRRALAFIAAEQQKVKQAQRAKALKRQRECDEEDAARQ